MSADNISDKKQVKKAGHIANRDRKEELEDLDFILNTAQGRRVIWRIMEKCGTFRSIWESSARIHFNAGQQDIGHFLMAEIVDTGEKNLARIMLENFNEKGE